MHVCPTAFAIVNFDCEQEKDEEKAGHSKTYSIYCREAHKFWTCFAHLYMLTQRCIKAHLKHTEGYIRYTSQSKTIRLNLIRTRINLCLADFWELLLCVRSVCCPQAISPWLTCCCLCCSFLEAGQGGVTQHWLLIGPAPFSVPCLIQTGKASLTTITGADYSSDRFLRHHIRLASRYFSMDNGLCSCFCVFQKCYWELLFQDCFVSTGVAFSHCFF